MRTLAFPVPVRFFFFFTTAHLPSKTNVGVTAQIFYIALNTIVGEEGKEDKRLAHSGF